MITYTRLLSNPFRKFINWLWKNFRSIIKRKFSLRRLRFRPCHFDWQLNVLWKAFKVSDFLYASARNLSCHPIYEDVDVSKKLIDLFDIYQGNSFFNSSYLERWLIMWVLFADYGRPERKKPSLHGRKFTPTPKFLGTAEAYFVSHFGPIFQISLIYAFIGCPYSVGLLFKQGPLITK